MATAGWKQGYSYISCRWSTGFRMGMLFSPPYAAQSVFALTGWPTWFILPQPSPFCFIIDTYEHNEQECSSYYLKLSGGGLIYPNWKKKPDSHYQWIFFWRGKNHLENLTCLCTWAGAMDLPPPYLASSACMKGSSMPAAESPEWQPEQITGWPSSRSHPVCSPQAAASCLRAVWFKPKFPLERSTWHVSCHVSWWDSGSFNGIKHQQVL